MVIAPILRTINKGISTGIGLAGEKYHDHKERKAAFASQDQSKAGDVEVSVRELIDPMEPGAETANDERIWALDEAAGDPPSYGTFDSEAEAQRPSNERSVSALVQEVVTAKKADQQYEETPASVRLPFPVIIPQRRPGSKARGWSRAYPPDLEAFGIDQDTFLTFLGNFETAAQASPWLRTVWMAAGAVGFIPSHITMAVSISVQVAAGTAIELQSRYKANAFLDQMNRDVFMPLGLYCMVLLNKETPVKPNEVEFGMQEVDMETAKQISKWGLPKKDEDDELNVSKKAKILRPIRLVSGKTDANTTPMMIAPLLYPGLEDMMERPQIKRDESFKERLLRNREFVAEYFDRRARADYAGNNPDSALTKASADMPEFHSRFADPNHPCNNGHLFSLVTGGKYVAQPRGRRSHLREVGEDGKLKPKIKQDRKIRGPLSLIGYGVRKVVTPNILYLTIVNLPSEEELAEARSALGIDDKALKEMMTEMRTGESAT
ncbi:hypothetical protein K491DRAFT_686979 [Lophiostoma macrostomum CBS 122681]|uniref:Uncharacterized protein n=1 Tax=Lophiostoma macrostomum CBS 122681 TaxID=1314788 RepID=A0A6A6TPJ5_9PLEO|nr:hypothetical protein K491DRAFT_686979 [Lophiostoma macrostomum CBS 122681]